MRRCPKTVGQLRFYMEAKIFFNFYRKPSEEGRQADPGARNGIGVINIENLHIRMMQRELWQFKNKSIN